jgi:hypothetical protein
VQDGVDGGWGSGELGETLPEEREEGLYCGGSHSIRPLV